MFKFVLSAILFVLTILFACLKRVWSGFTYFALVASSLLVLFWTTVLIVEYIQKYGKKSMQERYRVYCAMLVNTSALTLDIIHAKDKIYYKRFRRTLIKEKAVEWLKIMLAFGLFVAIFFVFI